MDRLGKKQGAQKAFKRFEEDARLEIENTDNANRSLIFYYTDHAENPEEALRIAEIEIGHRQDVYTLDAHAWALFSAGQYQLAQEQVEKALAIGIRDARISYHAGAIAEKANDISEARRHYEQVVRLNPISEWAHKAQDALQMLNRATSLASDFSFEKTTSGAKAFCHWALMLHRGSARCLTLTCWNSFGVAELRSPGLGASINRISTEQVRRIRKDSKSNYSAYDVITEN